MTEFNHDITGWLPKKHPLPRATNTQRTSGGKMALLTPCHSPLSLHQPGRRDALYTQPATDHSEILRDRREEIQR